MATRGNAANEPTSIDAARAAKERFTVDELLAIEDTPTREIEVAEWGGKTLLLRGLTKKQQADIRNANRVGEDDFDADGISRSMFRAGVVEPEFTDAQVMALWEKQAGVIDGILLTIIRLSGMDREATKRWEELFRKGT